MQSKLKYILKLLQKKIELAPTRLGGMPIDGNENCALTALCGEAKHTSSLESYFQYSYTFEKLETEKCIFVINNEGHLENILPLIKDEKDQSITWTCDEYCQSADPDVRVKRIKKSI